MKVKPYSFLVFFLASSCSNIGSTLLPYDRITYNEALQSSDTQQELLNIVRLRYSDPPYFLTVNNVVSQFSLSRDASVSVSNNLPPPPILATGNAGTSFSESPTITYTPLQGEQFITRLLTPIDLSVIYMLLRSGWGINHVFRVLVQQIGSVENAVIASRSTSGRIPHFETFLKLGLALRELQYHDELKISSSKRNDEFAIKIRINHYSKLNARQRAILARMDVTAQEPYFWLVSHLSRKPHDVYLQTRTVLGLLNYLSKGVDIPPEDIANKQAPMTYYKNGTPFDWHRVTVGMMRVHTSNLRPTNDYASIQYRHHWFYIPNDDFESKETLNLMAIIMGIYSGEIKTFQPVFTVS